MQLFLISGTFVIPGTLKSAKLEPVKICAKSKQEASVQVVPILREQFMQDIPVGTKIGNLFALLFLKIEEVI